MTKQEQAALIEFARSLETLEERSRQAAEEYHLDLVRSAFHDGQAHAFGRAATDLWDVLGVSDA